MTDQELDELLAGKEELIVSISRRGGAVIKTTFDRRALAEPTAWRSALRRALGDAEGWSAPVYSQEDHDKIVRVMFTVADHDERFHG